MPPPQNCVFELSDHKCAMNFYRNEDICEDYVVLWQCLKALRLLLWGFKNPMFLSYLFISVCLCALMCLWMQANTIFFYLFSPGIKFLGSSSPFIIWVISMALAMISFRNASSVVLFPDDLFWIHFIIYSEIKISIEVIKYPNILEHWFNDLIINFVNMV